MAKSSLYTRIYGEDNKKRMIGGSANKNEFLLFVFANLIVQLGITYYMMENFDKKDDKFTKSLVGHLGLFLLLMTILFVLSFIQMPEWVKFIVFSFFSSIFGIYLSSWKNRIDPKIIQMSVAGTISIFITLFIVASFLVILGIRFGTTFGTFLLCSLLFLIISEVVVLFLGNMSIWIRTFSVIAFFLFSLYILYDTNQILQRNYSGDFITASLDYYLDILNLFLNVTNIINR